MQAQNSVDAVRAVETELWAERRRHGGWAEGGCRVGAAEVRAIARIPRLLVREIRERQVVAVSQSMIVCKSRLRTAVTSNAMRCRCNPIFGSSNAELGRSQLPEHQPPPYNSSGRAVAPSIFIMPRLDLRCPTNLVDAVSKTGNER